ncbi:tyrosine-type recombinase/integrase [Streptomyces sp. H39-C1]|uniref:tyrosine-type recombinase/integrase n=1 Tax=Streptomyces sp. H39-C1 TaxID=3004355 RepID=UPI0022AF7433|nr:site-specific integrase [Streptomyces sp. H39-C1]MCZ4102451.1 site-specific integrase [Streptomyces sp. H39-C1]
MEAITMRSTVHRGRVYRRCGCRDQNRRQLGAHCPQLTTDPDHGSWTFAVDLPSPTEPNQPSDHTSPTRHRHTVRRGGFPTQDTARAALHRLLDGAQGGFDADPNQTLTVYLTAWLKDKELTLKPTTYARYRDYTRHDLIPAFGDVLLDDLGHQHIAAFVHTQLAAGRGKVTIHRCLATLSSALGEAVRHQRLTHNPARPTLIPRPAAAERTIWTVPQAIRFLDFCRHADPPMADLVEVLIGTGIRKGEALGLHWNDVHPSQDVLYIRYTLSAVDNNQLVLTAPKTRTSKTWVAISPRVAGALQRRAHDKPPSSENAFRGGLVFHQPDGRPLHPGYVLNHFHDLSRQAHVPRTTLHDLRHLAATISITAGVPLTVVSKTLRHSTLSTTANIYSHLTAQAAHDAVDSIDHTLTASDRTTNRNRRKLRPRPQPDHNPRAHNRMNILKTAPPRADCTHEVRAGRRGTPHCDHHATTGPRNAEKAASAFLRKRPPTCENAGRDDRI